MNSNLKKMIAGLLFTVMLAGSVPGGAVYALEMVPAGTQDENLKSMDNSVLEQEESADISDSSDSRTGQTETVTVPEEEEILDDENLPAEEESNTENVSDEVIPEENNTVGDGDQADTGLINFVYIESPYLATPDTQRIVFAFNEDAPETGNITLTVQDESGSQTEWPAANQTNGLYLFEKDFTGEAYTGIYKAVSINIYRPDTVEILDLSKIGIEAKFGVNEEYDGYEELQPLDEKAIHNEEGVTASVVAIDENGMAESQDSIAEALSAASAQINSVGAFGRMDKETESRSGNIIVALDPGHDSRSTGASGNGLHEEELTLKIAKYCKEELEQYAGVEVYMTRTGADCPFQMSGSGCIQYRVRDAYEAGAQIYVSLHLNSSVSTSSKGAEVIIQNNNWKPELGTESSALANEILDELVKLGLKDRGLYSKDSANGSTYDDGSSSDYYAVNRYCKIYGIPGIIVEHAFISNKSDADNYLKSEAGLKSLGVADATGIAKYLGLSKGHWEYIEGQGWKYSLGGNYITNQWLLYKGEWYFLDEEGIMKTGWLQTGGEWYYLDDAGVMQVDWQLIDGKWYYMNADGVMQTGWQLIRGKWYYMNGSGIMQTGWLESGTKKLYLGPNGDAYIGWHTIEGKKYYFDSDGYMVTGKVTMGEITYEFASTGELVAEYHKPGWEYSEGKWYYYDANGIKTTGWRNVGGKWYYMDSDGVMKTDWQLVDGKWYYMNSSGTMQTGWQLIKGKWYYMNSSGVMQTGWLNSGTKKLYLGPNGDAYIGWHTIEGEKYYFDVNGYMLTGRQTIDGVDYEFASSGELIAELHKPGWEYSDGKWYYYDSNGMKTTGWRIVSGKWYYMDADGVMQTGWQMVAGKWYYMNSSGAMQTGWQSISGKWYYMNSSGAMQTGWRNIGGKWYYMDSNGVMKTDWQLVDGKWYYMNSSGAMQTGWQLIKGKWYYMNSSGVMQTGWLESGTKKLYLGPNGDAYIGWHTIEGEKYYFDVNGYMLTGRQTIDGVDYEFASSGELIAEPNKQGWEYSDGKWYYYDSNGMKTTGWRIVSGKWYYMDADGVMQTGWQMVAGKWYYMNSSGVMLTDWQRIDEKWYYFDPSGAWVKKEPVEGTYLIQNTSSVTVEQMVDFFNNSGFVYPASALEKGGAPDLKTFCEIFYEESEAEGIAVEVAYTQTMLETGWLQFGGAVKIEQFNFGGLGAVDGGGSGADFSSYGQEAVRMGVRAQIQHLKAYASNDSLNNECVDPRFKYVKRGSAKYVEWLGQKENPDGYGWATGTEYGIKILKMINDLKKI